MNELILECPFYSEDFLLNGENNSYFSIFFISSYTWDFTNTEFLSVLGPFLKSYISIDFSSLKYYWSASY